MKEFENERAAIANQIASVHGFQVNTAEQWGALSDNAQKLYRGGVQQSHIYVGLFGHVYSPSTREEYDEACQNPYRQKLIYLKRLRSIDPEVAELIRLFQSRHKPYTFNNLWDLLPRVLVDLDSAVEQILNQSLERDSAPPIAHSETENSVSLQAWKNKQEYFSKLYRNDNDLTFEYLSAIRDALRERGMKVNNADQTQVSI